MDAVLVGLVLPHVENHGLEALAAAAVNAGFEARTRSFCGWPDVPEIVADVMREPPRVVGVSIHSTESAIASLALCRQLRDAGYAGHIVCGGHFSTLNAERILQARAGIDVVVRFAGERALVGLLADSSDDALAGLPGVMFKDRQGTIRLGAPADLEPPGGLAASMRGGPLPRHLGFAAADLVSSRGCEHHCTYCCVAGASALASEEAQRAGASPRSARAVQRSTASIADEIAGLYRQNDARVFNFMDDNLLPSTPRQVELWARELAAALRARSVPEVALTMQLRADAVDPASAGALAELGLVRAYVGIDGYSRVQLAQLGRRAEAEAGPRALAELSARGIYCVANALLVGPMLRFADVNAEIDGIARITSVPVHLLGIDVRAGTAYHDRARSRGLIEGSWFWPFYRIEDDRARAFAEIVLAIPLRLAQRSVPIALYDLGYNLGIVRRLLPDAVPEGAEAAYPRIAGAWNAEQLRFLRAAIAAVESGRADEVARVITETNAIAERADRAWIAECDAWLQRIEDRVRATRCVTARAHARGRLLGAVAFSMSLAACGPGVPDPDSTMSGGGHTTTTTMPVTTTATTTNTPATGITMTASATSGNITTTGDASTTSITTTASEVASTGPTLCIDPEQTPAEFDEGAVKECCIDCQTVVVVFDSNGVAIDFQFNDGKALPANIRDCLVELFADHCYPSAAGQDVPISCHCWVA